MSDQHDAAPEPEHLSDQGTIEMPSATVAPMVLALGMILFAAGAPFGLAFTIVGGLVLFSGVAIWVSALLPGRGHMDEPLEPRSRSSRSVRPELNTVAHLQPGMPGYRARLPEAVHPLSAGVKGGIVGGLVMPVPALLYGMLSGHGIWYPINLLAGMVVPGVGAMSTAQLEQFSLALLLTGIFIHATIAVVFGLLYGVLLPMLPEVRLLAVPKSLAWGGIILPLLWTAVSYGLMGVTNPVLQTRVDWRWFIVSQFVFGMVAAYVVDRSEKIPVPPAGSGLN